MNVVFVDLLNRFYDKHGIYSLASVLSKNNINVEYIGETSSGSALSRLARVRPDAVLYSAFSYNVPLYCKFDAKLKDICNAISVIGGPGPTFDYDSIRNTTIDAFCVGEGELALLDFLQNDFRFNRNIVSRNEKPSGDFFPFVVLDDLPLPSRDVVYRHDRLLRDFPSKQFISGRGCPYECTYCFNHKYKNIFSDCGDYVRKKSVDYLINEIKDVKKHYPLDQVVFNDDTFIINKKWFLDFCNEFPGKIGLPYTCNVRPNLIDEDIAKALSLSGCAAVNWSIESGNDFFRNVVLKRGILKEQIVNTAELLRKYGIPFRIGNIIGLPGEKIENIFETIELNIKAKPDLALANIFVPFPGLTLTEYSIKKGYYSLRDDRSLPENYFTRSAMNYNRKDRALIKKLLFMFPIFVRWPFLFNNVNVRRAILSLSVISLKLLYNLFYPISLMRFYRIKVRLIDRVKVFLRQ